MAEIDDIVQLTGPRAPITTRVGHTDPRRRPGGGRLRPVHRRRHTGRDPGAPDRAVRPQRAEHPGPLPGPLGPAPARHRLRSAETCCRASSTAPDSACSARSSSSSSRRSRARSWRSSRRGSAGCSTTSSRASSTSCSPFPGSSWRCWRWRSSARGLIAPVIALSIAYLPYIARVLRSGAIRERALPYIDACYAEGLPTRTHRRPPPAAQHHAARAGAGDALVRLRARRPRRDLLPGARACSRPRPSGA